MTCACKRCKALKETEAALAAVFGDGIRMPEAPAEPKIKVIVPLDKPTFSSNVKRVLAEQEAANKVERAINRFLYLEE